MSVLQVIGVEAVVEGVQDFLGDIDKVNGALDKLRPQTTWLQDAFNNASDAVGNFGEHVLNVVETALGIMLRDAIEWVIGKLGDMAKAAFEAGNEFQLMKMRLQGFNLQDAIDSGMDYTSAMGEAVKVTEQQMSWIMKLAATTPFDATDIANIYTLSKSYGFGNKAAEQMTTSILDFTAAMGLSGTEANRLIVNLGQMAQRGKITTREMNDLARGAFVPIRDILDRISVKMGITTGELTKMIQAPGGGVDYQLFIDAFNEMVAQEARFQDGAVRMAHTFKGAWENIVQTIRDVIGGFILLPGFLDPIGKALGNIMDSVGQYWDEIKVAAEGVGKAIGSVVTELLDKYMPSGADIATGMIGWFNRLTLWINTHKPDILKFFDGIVEAIKSIRDWITEVLVPAFDKIALWVGNNGALISEFFQTLGEIIGGVFTNLFGGKENAVPGESPLDKILAGIKDAMQWVIDNKLDLIDFFTQFVAMLITLQITLTIINVVLGGVISLIEYLINPANWISIIFTAVAIMTVMLNTLMTPNGKGWESVGSDIIKAICLGLVSMTWLLAQTLTTIVANAVANALAALGFGAGGGGSGKGGLGQTQGAGSLAEFAVGQSKTTPTSGGVIGSKTGGSWSKTSGQSSISTSSKNVATTNNFNLTVNTAATKENITSDFRTLAALNNYAT